MATTRSKTLGCGSVSSWMRILRLSFMSLRQTRRLLWHGLLTVPRFLTEGLLWAPDIRGDLRSGRVARSGDRATTGSPAPHDGPRNTGNRLLVEWVLQRVLLCQDVLDLGFTAHSALDGELGRVVVVLVDLVVVLGVPVDEDAHDEHQVLRFAFRDDALGHAVEHRHPHGFLRGAKHLHRLASTLDGHLGDHHRSGLADGV